jgi:hypothetical protein
MNRVVSDRGSGSVGLVVGGSGNDLRQLRTTVRDGNRNASWNERDEKCI